MPRLSDSMVDGTIANWLRADGDEISVGEEFVEIETDKAIMPFEAEHAGTLKIVAREGESIAVGAVIGYIGEPEPEADAEAPVSGSEIAGRTATAAVAAPPASRQAAGGGTTLVTQNGHNGRVKASPLARRIAASLGVALEALSGSGPGGRIVKKDVQAAAGSQQQEESAAVPAGAPSSGTVERRPLTTTQATIARRMVEAKAAVPEFTVTVTVDMEKTVALRSELIELEPDRKVSLGDFVVKACARALREHPVVNSSFVDGALEQPSRVNIGIAVAAPGSLLVPTLYDADTKSIGQIGEETRGLAARARAGQLTPAEMSNATFTVSNLGMFGVSHFTAVINPPQAAILAVGAVEQQVVVHEDGFVARRRMTMTLTADHRVIYGADAAAFLASVRDGLEHPLKLVI
jgi:pyruvate dehydrogenase E2 component (dihydrolipoamide acetyltransferase)